MSIQSTSSALGGAAVTPSDTVKTAKSFRALWVGGAGNVAVLHHDGSVATYTGVAAGTILPVAGLRVNASGTTATAIVAMF